MPASTKTAPRFLSLRHIRFPVGAVASIGHRVSGALLALALPVLAWALERSLRSAADYAQLAALAHSRWLALPAFVALWALAHHVLAGIRHLLMDVGIGAPLRQARASARAVIVAAFALALAATIGWFA
jgi:succinate dehydrogenase / fumarate reductase cytochrome b subunit